MISLLVENSDTVEAFLYRECVIDGKICESG